MGGTFLSFKQYNTDTVELCPYYIASNIQYFDLVKSHAIMSQKHYDRTRKMIFMLLGIVMTMIFSMIAAFAMVPSFKYEYPFFICWLWLCLLVTWIVRRWKDSKHKSCINHIVIKFDEDRQLIEEWTLQPCEIKRYGSI